MRLNIHIRVLLFALHLDTLIWGSIIRISGFECHAVDPTFCRFENCVIKPVRRGVKEVNMVVRLLQVPVTNASLHVEISRRGYSTQSLYQFDIDCCQFWQSKRRNPIAKAMYNFFRLGTYSNMNHSCPYNHDLILDHLQLDKDLNLHLPIGKGDYIVKGYWLAYNVLRGNMTLTMQITD